MIYIALLSIIILFFLFALLISPFVKKHFGFKICAICAASSITWLVLLTIRTLKIYEIDNTLISVLMGGSVVGIMFELERYFKKNSIGRFWIVRVLELTVGFYLVYSITIGDTYMIGMGIIGLFLIIIIVLMLKTLSKSKDLKLYKAKSKEENITKQEKLNAINKLEKSLEDCC